MSAHRLRGVRAGGQRVDRTGAATVAGDRARACPLALAAVVDALQACRGIQLIHAARIVAELGDLSRFSHPRELMAYLGLIPSENSSGDRRRQGAITKAGNNSARRALVKAAWAYRHGPAVSSIIVRRQSGLPKAAIAIAWKAQLRLCARFRRLSARGINRNKVVVAIARELSGFVWAISRQVKPN
jgi:transposase